MAKLKNLSNCTFTEFLFQTNKIRKAVEKWLTDTDIMNIRQKMPMLGEVPAQEKYKDGMTDKEKAEVDSKNEERERIIEENDKKLSEQSRENLKEILDSVMGEHPEETAGIIAMCCFIEPENKDDYQTRDYLAAFTEMINDDVVFDFFVSSVRRVLNLSKTGLKL